LGHRFGVRPERRGKSQDSGLDLIFRRHANQLQRCRPAFIRTLDYIANRIDGENRIWPSRAPESRYL
jgi:hypothetical protein